MKKINVNIHQLKLALYKSILFSGLDDVLINKIAKLIKCYFIKKKEKVVIERQKGQDIFIVVSGKINVYFQNNKKRFLVTRLLIGDIFGEIGFFTKQRTANCESAEDTIIGVIKYKNFSKFLFSNKQIIFNLIKTLISRILETDKEIKNLVFRPVIQRVANVILSETYRKKAIILNIHSLSQKTAAARETVSRTISLLEKTGILKRQQNMLVVTNRQKLKEILR
ncbi:MAG: Crp/Fnr family transcriptional regulator [Endomicrobia bacterium]|nr:Crp/Fnr family transcriptional regulator [Endomicrobiia bacterium]MDW8056261.1 Crp/Fnr family transcriptional regulator [Elusimicrobiota bacterium]